MDKNDNADLEQQEQDEETEEESEETEDDSTEETVDWKKEALKYKSINERLQRKINTKREETPVTTKRSPVGAQKNVADLERKLERIEIMQQGYSKDAADFLMEVGGAQALENPYIKKAVTELEQEKKQQQAVDVDGDAGSATTRKHTIEDLRKMDLDELEKALS